MDNFHHFRDTTRLYRVSLWQILPPVPTCYVKGTLQPTQLPSHAARQEMPVA